MRMFINIFNLLILTFCIFSFGLIIVRDYLQNRYINSMRNYYKYVEKNQDRINKIIARSLLKNEKDIDIMINSLNIYIELQNDLSFEQVKNIDKLLENQRNILDTLPLEEYKNLYYSSQYFENNEKNIKLLIEENFKMK